MTGVNDDGLLLLAGLLGAGDVAVDSESSCSCLLLLSCWSLLLLPLDVVGEDAGIDETDSGGEALMSSSSELVDGEMIFDS